MPPKHLYVHVPFCARRCVYCDFSIAVRKITPVAEYLAALAADLRQTLEATSAGEPIVFDTVYLGGGTPSRLGPDGIRAALELIRDAAGISANAEVSIEANPEDVTASVAADWRDAGVTRISLGAQSFDDGVLKWMHRNHSGEDIGRAVDALRAGGIVNISIDLIFAIPEFLNRSWTTDLEKAIALATPHISIYGLTLEPKTALGRWTASGEIPSGDEEKYAAEFLETDQRLVAAGFDHYEVSNFARDGMLSRHNSAYWTGAEYIGVGPSAHSLFGGERRWNVSAYGAWQSRVMAGQSAVEGRESLSESQQSLERVYLGLRTKRGYRTADVDAAAVNQWIGAGWGSIANGSLKLTPAGWLRLDSLAAALSGPDAADNYITADGTPTA